MSKDLRELGMAYAATPADAALFAKPELGINVGTGLGQPGGYGGPLLGAGGAGVNERNKFRAVSYKQAARGQVHVASCPEGMDTAKWKDAAQHIAESRNLQPVPVVGFSKAPTATNPAGNPYALFAHSEEQQRWTEELRKSAKQVAAMAESLQLKAEGSTQRMKNVQAKQRELSMRLLEQIRNAELLQSIGHPKVSDSAARPKSEPAAH